MVNTFIPANLQWVGVARETVNGTPVAAPTLFVPADSPAYHHVQPPLKDQSTRGSMAATFGQVPGIAHDEFSFKANAYIDSVYFFLRSALGLPDVISGSAAPYTHKTSLLNVANAGQPQATTVFWNDGNGKCWQMPGSQIAEVKITAKSDGLYTLDVKYVGLPSTIIASPANSPTTALPMPSWSTTLSLAGVPTPTYSEIDIDIKRATEMITTITGTNAPYAIYAGQVEVTGTITSVYQGSTDTNWADYLANTQPAITLKTSPSGDAVNSILVQMSRCGYDDVQVSGTNKYLELKATIEALANPTDALDGFLSPAQAVLVGPTSTVI